MKKKRLTLLDKERAKVKNYEIGAKTLRSQNEALTEQLSRARTEKTTLEYKFKPIKVKSFGLYDLTNGSFESWQRQNPGFQIIKWHVTDMGAGQYPQPMCLVFYKE